MKIKAVSVKCFELFAEDGTSLGLFKVESEWHGMQQLRAVVGREQVIVDATGVETIFGNIFGDQRAEVLVVKISPELCLLATTHNHESVS